MYVISVSDLIGWSEMKQTPSIDVQVFGVSESAIRGGAHISVANGARRNINLGR